MKTALRILIADDETPARNRLRTLLQDIDANMWLQEAKNGHEVLSMVNAQAFDIILLDIRMPSMDGIEAAQHLNRLPKPPAIIFTTAFDAYAMQAFDLQAIDYLLKPIRQERLQLALNKARVLKTQDLQALNPLIAERKHLSIIERGKIVLIPLDEIIYFRAEFKYITVRTKAREYLLEDSLNHLEATFNHGFIRLHRNVLVAEQFIVAYEKRRVTDQDAAALIGEKQWVAILKHVPDVVAVSRRKLHLIKQNC